MTNFLVFFLTSFPSHYSHLGYKLYFGVWKSLMLRLQRELNTWPSSVNAWHLKPRHPFVVVPAAQHLISSSDNNTRAAFLADHRWKAKLLDNTTRLRTFIPDIATHPPGMTLPRTMRVRLNRLRTSVGRFRSFLHKWGVTSSAACECSPEEQTIEHTVLHCPIHWRRDDYTTWRFSTMRHNRMTAQHLPRYLVRPISGQ